MKESLQKVEKKKEIRGVIGTGTGRGIETEEEKGIERKAKMGKETGRRIEIGIGIVTKTVIGNVTAIIETATGIEVRGGKGAEVEMMRITTGVETTTGNGLCIYLPSLFIMHSWLLPLALQGFKLECGYLTSVILFVVCICVRPFFGLKLQWRSQKLNCFLISFTGGEIMIKNAKTDTDVGLVLAQREYLSIGQGPLLHRGQDHAPKGWIWTLKAILFLYMVLLYMKSYVLKLSRS